MAGLKERVSSKVPAFIIAKSSIASASEYRGEPHRLQKQRRKSWPLSPLSM